MISVATEQKFREYISMYSRYEVLAGGRFREDFERIWREVIADPDVEAVFSQMLFVPVHIPDHIQGAKLLEILDYLHGYPTLLLSPDVRVTEAKIDQVRVVLDGEGPSYFVTYSFEANDETFTFEREYGYDSYHAAANGWDRAALHQHWQAGRKIRCHYFATNPRQHAICVP